MDLKRLDLLSPNGDGKNEFFEIMNMEYYPKTRLSIVNRWGKEIYSTAIIIRNSLLKIMVMAFTFI